jgi:hypothetical protein
MPQASNVVDSSYGYASGAFRYVVTLQPGESKTFSFAIPDSDKNIVVNDSGVRQEWESTVNRIEINLPKKYGPLMDMIRSQLAYILINKDGPTIQPGSRSYERGWIRDGSMTSAALLRMGLTTDVREYLDWYSRHQYPSGKIPCIVDSRGPEPTPENDSPGQYLFALLQYFYFTHDTLFLKTKWENVQKTVSYIQSLRAERMIDRYRSGNDSLRAFYGLVTESISHEGYSAKPMHSYWDNFFVLRGLKDAATIARVIGERNVSVYYDSLARAFRTNLLESFLLTMRNHSIDYLPGCVELGDFDATSTTVSLYPCGEKDYLPQLALRNTFKKYLEFFDHRIQKDAWINFTPYEIRIVGSLVYLGMKEDAHRVLDWLMSYRRPPGWNHWAEVVWRDSKTPQYIGDMPHTWVGSDYVNAFRAMFAYEEEEDSVLVIGAGIRDAWLQEPEGISVSNVPTYYGLLSFSIMPSGRSVIVDIKETLTAKRIVVKSPLTKPIRIARINGVQMAPIDASEIRIEKAPARIELEY